MFLLISTSDENVVQVDEREMKIFEHLVHQALKGLGAVLHSERHSEILEQPEGGL